MAEAVGRKKIEGEAITRGTTNVFADLGFADAEERQTKLRLAHAINSILEKRNFVEAEAARILGVDRPTVSALVHYKLERFSVDRLMLFLTSLDRDVEIVINKKGAGRKPARISVIGE